METDRPDQSGPEKATGRILTIRIRRPDGVRDDVSELLLQESGDPRAVSLFTAQGRSELAADRARGLCFDRYLEDLTLELAPGPRLLPGVRITIGAKQGAESGSGPMLEVSEARKRCYAECPRQDKAACPLRRHAAFARVIRPGVVSRGAELTLSSAGGPG